MDQMKKLGATILKFNEAQFNKLFETADLNGDGEISFEEAHYLLAT